MRAFAKVNVGAQLASGCNGVDASPASCNNLFNTIVSGFICSRVGISHTGDATGVAAVTTAAGAVAWVLAVFEGKDAVTVTKTVDCGNDNQYMLHTSASESARKSLPDRHLTRSFLR